MLFTAMKKNLMSFATLCFWGRFELKHGGNTRSLWVAQWLNGGSGMGSNGEPRDAIRSYNQSFPSR